MTKEFELPDHRCGRPKFKEGNDGDKFKRKAQKSCDKCGAQPSHYPSRRPAQDAAVSACKNRGHYARIRKSSNLVQSVDNGSSEDVVSEITIGETASWNEKNSK